MYKFIFQKDIQYINYSMTNFQGLKITFKEPIEALRYTVFLRFIYSLAEGKGAVGLPGEKLPAFHPHSLEKHGNCSQTYEAHGTYC